MENLIFVRFCKGCLGSTKRVSYEITREMNKPSIYHFVMFFLQKMISLVSLWITSTTILNLIK